MSNKRGRPPKEWPPLFSEDDYDEEDGEYHQPTDAELRVIAEGKLGALRIVLNGGDRLTQEDSRYSDVYEKVCALMDSKRALVDEEELARMRALRSKVRRLSHRKTDRERCPCGEMTAKRAKQRRHRCVAPLPDGSAGWAVWATECKEPGERWRSADLVEIYVLMGTKYKGQRLHGPELPGVVARWRTNIGGGQVMEVREIPAGAPAVQK